MSRPSNIENPPSKIYLAGFMACGKSTVGPLLAQRLECDFVDLDEEVEVRAGRSIPEVFRAEGEAGFRRREAEALRATASRVQAVIALGGGALVEEENLHFARANGLVVYLKVSAGELARRLRATAGERPMLLDGAGVPLSEAALHDRIEALLARRRVFYEQAHVTIAADAPPETVAEAVERAMTSGGA